MRQRISILLVLGLMALACMMGVAADSHGAPAAEPGESPFTGVLVISFTGTEYSSTIGDARLEQIGDRTFIRGVGVDTGHPDWTIGATVRVPLDTVTHIVQFSDVEKYKQAIAAHKR